MFKRYLKKDGEFLERVWMFFKASLAERPLSTLLVTLGFLGLIWVLVKTICLGNTGFEPRTLWDWLELLFIPLLIAAGGWWFNARQEHRAEVDREQQSLDTYLNAMTELFAEQGLPTTHEPEAASDVGATVTARTLAVLRSLGPERASYLVQFLRELGLVGTEGGESLIELRGANLWGVSLAESDLSYWDLRGASLGDASLSRARLLHADLSHAYLGGANLREAYLSGANLRGAVLHGANLREANAEGTNFEQADLRRANLELAYLAGARFDGAVYDSNTRWPGGFDPGAAGAIIRE